jgi:SAM-dependent methyltransferase
MAALTVPNCYDVVVAGDVFVYVGKLDAVIPAARRALRPGGVLAFSIESAEDIRAAAGTKDYWLGPSRPPCNDARHGEARGPPTSPRANLRVEAHLPG